MVGKHPDMFDFIKTANLEESDQVKKYLEARTLSLAELKYDELLIEVDSYIELFRKTFYE